MLSPQSRTFTRPIGEVWPLTQPPLRPSAGNLMAFQTVIDDWTNAHPGRTPRALVLGATPELWSLAWPDRDKVSMVEPDPERAEQIWPGPESSRRVARWVTIGPGDGLFDIVLCDAGLHTLAYPNVQTNLRRHLAAVMPTGSLLAVRLIAPPAQREPTVSVASELWAGNIGDMSQLLIRLSHSLQQSPTVGVRDSAVWLKFCGLCKDWDTLLARTGWSPMSLAIAERYRFSPVNHYFVSPAEVLEVFTGTEGAPFEMVRLVTGGGPMAAQCPVITLERR